MIRQEAMCGTQEHKGEVMRFWCRELINTIQEHLEDCEEIKSSEIFFFVCSVFCDWSKGASAVVMEVEQPKCKSTCETSKIVKPVVEDSG